MGAYWPQPDESRVLEIQKADGVNVRKEKPKLSDLENFQRANPSVSIGISTNRTSLYKR